MNLPFTPTSFRKLDILQQLMEYESQKTEKSLWNGVKSVLIWAGSANHQHLGSFINPGHVKDALAYCVEQKFISEEERKRLVYSCPHILESLPVYGFGEQDPKTDSKNPSVKINRNGVLAGRILVETNFLRNTFWRYGIWIIVWWLVLFIAALIFILHFISAIKNVVEGSAIPQSNSNISKNRFSHNNYIRKQTHFVSQQIYNKTIIDQVSISAPAYTPPLELSIINKFFNNAAVGGAIGSFTAFIFGLIAYDYTKRREKWASHHNALVKTERLVNRHLNGITGNIFLLEGAIETYKKGAFSENVLSALETPDYMIDVININVINKYFDYEALLEKVNHDMVGWNKSNERLFDVALSGKVPLADIDRNRQELTKRSEDIVKNLRDLLEEAYTLCAYVRKFMNVDKRDRFARLELTHKKNLTELEVDEEREKIVKESKETMEKDKKRIERIKGKREEK